MRSRNKEHTTIIKRSSRKSHDTFHGGAWKVAFADFTLAMMALFMVLWIMGAVTEEERKEIVSLLNGESIFEGNSMTPVTHKEGNGGKIALLDTRHARKKTPLKSRRRKMPRLPARIKRRRAWKRSARVLKTRLRTWRASS